MAACGFSGDLFGWTFTDAVPADAPGHSFVATLDGQDVAAVGEPDADSPTVRNTDVAVDDADAAADAATAAGSSIVTPPVDVGPAGCRADLVDPAGAQAFYGAVSGWLTGDADDEAMAGMWRRPGYGDHLAATADPGIHARQSAVHAPPGFADAIA